MTRNQFGAGVAQTLSNVLQKHERAVLARAEADRLSSHAKSIKGMGSAADMAAHRATNAEQAVSEANTNLGASIDQFSDLLFDAFEQVIQRCTSPSSSVSPAVLGPGDSKDTSHSGAATRSRRRRKT